VAGSKLTQVLVDGGSGLNLLFVSTLKMMGLDITKMLTPSKGSILRNHSRKRDYTDWFGNIASYLWDKGNYRTEYIKFEVVNFEFSYHAMVGRPALAKFMAVPHYVYLLLKMSSKIGVLTFLDDLKKVAQLRSRGNRVCLDCALPVGDGDSSCMSTKEAGLVDGEA
jgi:hypothetical protein